MAAVTAGMHVQGAIRVPGDKSISHRALMLAALGDGASRITGILRSADVQSTAEVLRRLGAGVPPLSDDVVVHGRGRRGLRQPSNDLDCGNSGTTTRLMAGIVAGHPVSARFVGDESLSRRPMRRVARPLEAMGAHVETDGGLPMTVRGGELRPIEWRTEAASAQIKSAILLAGVVAGVPVTVVEPQLSRNHTEKMLAARGVHVLRIGQHGESRVSITPIERLKSRDMRVPSDPSSAAFFVALAALADGGSLALPGVCINKTRTGFLATVRRMGAVLNYDDRAMEGGEEVATIIAAPGELRGIEVGSAEVPSMIDELPMLACVAARAEGETVITGAAELRVKESDRIAAVVANLRALGVDAEELPDGMRVRGGGAPLRGAVRTHGDHRLAMAFGVLGALPGSDVRIDDPGCVAVSYPGFWDDLRRARAA